jgi:hypothetical protein
MKVMMNEQVTLINMDEHEHEHEHEQEHSEHCCSSSTGLPSLPSSRRDTDQLEVDPDLSHPFDWRISPLLPVSRYSD